MTTSRWTPSGRAAGPLLVLLALGTGCPPAAITKYTPTPTLFTTFQEKAGTIDTVNTCDPETPPPPTPPATPGSSEVLVGNQLWRNTVRDASNTECGTSRAFRFQGVVTFDMSAVAADISAKPFNSLTGTLTYTMGGFLESPNTHPNQLPLCVASVEKSAAAPTTGGLVPLNFVTGQTFPASAPPSLGARTLPDHVPFHQVYDTGVVKIDPSPPAPTVTLDLSLLLSDWASSRSPQLGVVFMPLGPTLESLGIACSPPNPVPDSLSTAQCTTPVQNVMLNVNVGR